MSMIGQFGVGFYSSYLVSEKVRVVSKSGDGEQYVWESGAGGTFLVWKDITFEHGVLKRGTKVICYLKDDQDEFLETDRLKDLIMKHSAFVGFPITLRMEHRQEEEVEVVEDGELEKQKKVTVSHAWELINKNKPLWLRPASEVTHEEYADLYKWLAGDWEDHLAVKHVVSSGQVDFRALLYCPKNPPKDMFDMGKMSQRFCIRLYVRRVFIKEFNDLIPKWMGFIKGIVDSDDMPLNISREMLQQNSILKHIKISLAKQVFQMFNELAKDKEKYKVFHESFSQCLKLGIYEDSANRDQISPLLRYHSSKSGEDLVSLDDYISRMKPGQRYILYITGRTKRDASRSPHAEGLKRDGYEVLYMYDPVDEYAVQFLKEYKGFEVLSCMSMDAARLLDHRSEADLKAELEPLRLRLGELLCEAQGLGLVSSVALASGMPADCCSRLAAAADANELPVLELNFKHGLLKELGKHASVARGAKPSPEEQQVLRDLAQLLFDMGALHGAEPDDPRRVDTCDKCQELIQGLSAGEQEAGATDLPPLGAALRAEVVAESVEIGQTQVAGRQAGPLLSCGSYVRVAREDRARRAMISFVDDATVDVLYPRPKGAGQEEEEEGVPMKLVQPLADFELDVAGRAGEASAFQESLFKTATASKEQGNQLFKLKDFDAAAERYGAVLAAFAARSVRRGDQVLVVAASDAGPRTIQLGTVTSVDAEGNCELSKFSGEFQASSLLPVCHELLPLHTSVYMNRARCRQNLGRHREAAQDLTAVVSLWKAADRRLLEADPEMKDAEVKGLYTAEYLRGRSRLALGLARQAAQDVRDALARNPPAATVKQLKQLRIEVQAAQEKQREVNGPLAKELAKTVIAMRGGPKIF
ncbi:unnamed protein product [Polarella glacialis]|uniref:Heat shock protein 90 n=1 Tax=Polarella glacialis TaxID=89957 RepID=A0A813D5G0_POLGL|nr:unnamed protein product [Polarella glacialis]